MPIIMPTGAAKEYAIGETIPPDEPENKDPIYVTHPDGKMDWFYCLFGRCFAKLVLMENRYYHRVCCFKYSTDGLGSYGIYVPPDEVFPIDEDDFYRPGSECCPLLLCGLCLYCRWKKYSRNYKQHGKQYANYMYYVKEKHYNYHVCCSPDFTEY